MLEVILKATIGLEGFFMENSLRTSARVELI